MEKLLICLEQESVTEKHLAQVRELVPDMEVVVTDDEERIAQYQEEVAVAAGHCPRELLLDAPQLRWYQQWSAGVDWLLQHPEAAEKDFILTNASGVHAIPITEHIIAFLLAFARNLNRAICAQVRHEWDFAGKGEDIFELTNKTLVLVGVGAIGTRTAEVANVLGMRVIGVRRTTTARTPGVTTVVGPEQLLEVLPEADFVVLTVPLTDETRNMIGEAELRAMKPNAILVNIGRGGTIDEEALVRALQEGTIGGAGLDVFETEPLPEESPLWEMENVIITGHYAGRTPHYDERAWEIFLDNLKRFAAGEPLYNVVDKELGY